MKKIFKSLLFIFATIIVIMIYSNTCYAAQGYTEIPAETEEPSKGNVFLGVIGEFDTHSKAAIKLINKYRKEACDKRYTDPRDKTRKLSPADYVPIKWSRDLEEIARIRAAECNIRYDHSRPNQREWYDITTENGIHSCAECIANECQDTMSDGIRKYYDIEKKKYLRKQYTISKHYAALINPDNIYIGIGHMYDENVKSSMNVCELMSKKNIETLEYQLGKTLTINTKPLPNPGRVICNVEVKKKYVSKPEIYEFNEWQINIKDYWTTRHLLRCIYHDDDYYSMGCYMGNVKWTCNSKYLKITDDGIVIPKKYTKIRQMKFKYSGDLKGSTYFRLAVVPEPGELVKVKAGKGKLYVKFKKKDTASGYRLRLIQGSFISGYEENYREIYLPKNKNSYTFTNLPKGWMWVFVEPYKEINGKKVFNTSTDSNNRSVRVQ